MATEASASRPRRGAAFALGRLVSRMCTDDEDGASLALARIGVALVVTTALLGHVGAVAEYFSDASELRGAWAKSAFSTRWSPLFVWAEPWQARALFGVGVVAQAQERGRAPARPCQTYHQSHTPPPAHWHHEHRIHHLSLPLPLLLLLLPLPWSKNSLCTYP